MELSGNYNIRYGVKVICDAAFRYCDDIFTLSIPEGVTVIGFMAFYNCKFSQQTINDIIERFGNAPFVDVDSKLDSLLKRGIVF